MAEVTLDRVVKRTFLIKNPSVMIFIALLAILTRSEMSGLSLCMAGYLGALRAFVQSIVVFSPADPGERKATRLTTPLRPLPRAGRDLRRWGFQR